MSWGKEHLYTFCRVHVVVPNMGNTELYLSSCGCTKFGRHSRHTRQIAIPVTVYSCLATRAGVFRSSSATRSATEGKGGILSERFFPAAVHALGKRNTYIHFVEFMWLCQIWEPLPILTRLFAIWAGAFRSSYPAGCTREGEQGILLGKVIFVYILNYNCRVHVFVPNLGDIADIPV